MSRIKLYNFLIVFLSVYFASNAQEIITRDGISMGPKSIFMEVCTENMSSIISKKDALYNVDDFCDCMADELLPTYTKKQISYYFTENHMDEMFQDSISNNIIVSCVKKNVKFNSPPLPPPMAMPDKANEKLIDKLIEVSDYKGLFNFLKDSIIIAFANEHNWSNAKTDSIYLSIKFENQPQSMYHNAYYSETKENLEIMIRVFEETESYSLVDNMSFYSKMIINNYKNSIISTCERNL